MIRIAITNPEPVDSEALLIRLVLNAGWDYVHIRHPHSSSSEVRKIIEGIPQSLHCRLRIHGHFELINEFNLGGIHLNNRCPNSPRLYTGLISKSCHSVSEVIAAAQCDYVFLSPIFSSISKPGYGGNSFSPDELSKINNYNTPSVIALGGITPQTARLLDYGIFDGYAVLGSLLGNCETEEELTRRIESFDN